MSLSFKVNAKKNVKMVTTRIDTIDNAQYAKTHVLIALDLIMENVIHA